MAEDTDKGGNDPAQAFQNALAKKSGDALQLASQLFDENFSLRGEKRTLKTEVAELRKSVPADGSIVLSPDKAKEYEAYKALGKPDDLKTRIDAHETLESEVKGLKKKEVIREVAEIHGFKPTVLEDRDKAAGGLEFVIKLDDKKRKVAYVKDGDKETPLTQYAEDNWADYLPSLKVEQGPTLQPRTGHGADPRPSGQNGREAYEISHKALNQSGRYGM